MVMRCSDTGFIHVGGITPEAIRTDNETLSNLKETLRKLNLPPKYVAPNNHDLLHKTFHSTNGEKFISPI
jgi:hypothetical protein